MYQTEFLPAPVHSYSTTSAASVLRPGTGCWDPKLDRALNKFKAMRLLWGKWSFLPAGRLPSTKGAPSPARYTQCHLPKAVPEDRHLAEPLL